MGNGIVLALFIGMGVGFALGFGFCLLGVKGMVRTGDLKRRR